jgi:hypothetical protein
MLYRLYETMGDMRWQRTPDGVRAFHERNALSAGIRASRAAREHAAQAHARKGGKGKSEPTGKGKGYTATPPDVEYEAEYDLDTYYEGGNDEGPIEQHTSFGCSTHPEHSARHIRFHCPRFSDQEYDAYEDDDFVDCLDDREEDPPLALDDVEGRQKLRQHLSLSVDDASDNSSSNHECMCQLGAGDTLHGDNWHCNRQRTQNADGTEDIFCDMCGPACCTCPCIYCYQETSSSDASTQPTLYTGDESRHSSSTSVDTHIQNLIHDLTYVTTGDSEWGCETFLGVKPPNYVHHKSQKSGGNNETSLSDGKVALLVDIGSVGNLAGDRWLASLAKVFDDAGRPLTDVEQIRRAKVLNVSGVGSGSQVCSYNTHIPIAIPTLEGAVGATFKVPTVPQSDLPGLLGLQSLRNARSIIDTETNKLYMLGPGNYDLMKAMPPGTSVVQLEESPSGHLMMPCDRYKQFDDEQKNGGLILDKQISLPVQTQPTKE